jgi:hypothetical protein
VEVHRPAQRGAAPPLRRPVGFSLRQDITKPGYEPPSGPLSATCRTQKKILHETTGSFQKTSY